MIFLKYKIIKWSGFFNKIGNKKNPFMNEWLERENPSDSLVGNYFNSQAGLLSPLWGRQTEDAFQEHESSTLQMETGKCLIHSFWN